MPKLPGIAYPRAVKAFEKAGFWIVRSGKHISMTNGERIIIIPRNNPIHAFTMAGIIKDAGLTGDSFPGPLQHQQPFLRLQPAHAAVTVQVTV